MNKIILILLLAMLSSGCANLSKAQFDAIMDVAIAEAEAKEKRDNPKRKALNSIYKKIEKGNES